MKIIQANPRHGTREELEPRLRAKVGPDVEIAYLGMLGPDRADDHWPVHAWRIGKPIYHHPLQVEPAESKPAREIKVEYRREVWTGSGIPVGPVDFSRPAPEEEAGPFPAPQVTSREPLTKPAPSAVAKMAAFAQAHGWTTEVTHSRGCIPHATHGRPGAVKELWAVRMSRGKMRAVAVQHSGGWKSLWTWSPNRIMARSRLVEEFQTELMGEF